MGAIRGIAIAGAVIVAGAVGAGLYGDWRTESDIAAFRASVAELGMATPAPRYDPAATEALPEPVRRYFAFVFDGSAPGYAVMRLEAEGQFRRPRTEAFSPTTAEQVIAVGAPALMFSATTPVPPIAWARAYDYFAEGEMEMKAKVFSLIAVVDFSESAELNRISLRRWLLESALYPQALLPGGPVTWEPIDADRARATVTADGLSASMIATFDASGRLTAMVAEADGDLSTPYHGSGEHVARSDYRRVAGQMIPHAFTISRMAGGALYPFWDGRVTDIRFESP